MNVQSNKKRKKGVRTKQNRLKGVFAAGKNPNKAIAQMMKEAEAREAEEFERDCEQISEESLDESTEHARSDAKLKGAIEGPASRELKAQDGLEELEHEIEEEIKRDYMTSELL